LKFTEAALAALQMHSKSSCTLCTFRFFVHPRLAIIGLIEFQGFLKLVKEN